MIYLDNNATTPLHPAALEAMMPFLRDRWGNPSSPYGFGREAREAVERARAKVAESLGARPDEIYFTGSGTEADNLALRGVVQASWSTAGKHVVTSSIEHHAVLHTCRALARDGCHVTHLEVDANGVVDPRELERGLTPGTVLVSVMTANNETGVIQPVAELARIARSREVLFHSDAVQALGKVPLRVDELGADLVSFSGHKVHGPKGVGALYVKKGTPISALICGGGQERALRAGTENVAGIVGFAEAVALAVSELAETSARLEALRRRLEAEIKGAMQGVRINGETVLRVPNTSSLSFASVDGESIVLALEVRGICISTGSACSTGDAEPSHVLRAMGLSYRQAQGSIRVSLGTETTERDVDLAVQAIVSAVEHLRSISSMEVDTYVMSGLGRFP